MMRMKPKKSRSKVNAIRCRRRLFLYISPRAVPGICVCFFPHRNGPFLQRTHTQRPHAHSISFHSGVRFCHHAAVCLRFFFLVYDSFLHSICACFIHPPTVRPGPALRYFMIA